MVNALVLQLVAYFVSGFHIDSFLSAFLGSLIVSFVSTILNMSIETKAGKRSFMVRRWSTSKTNRDDVIDV